MLHQNNQQVVFLASQAKCLAVQHHQLMTQIQEEMFITIEQLATLVPKEFHLVL
jgi:hypothetical protein